MVIFLSFLSLSLSLSLFLISFLSNKHNATGIKKKKKGFLDYGINPKQGIRNRTKKTKSHTIIKENNGLFHIALSYDIMGKIIDKTMKEQEKHKEIEKENGDGEKQKENNEGSRIEMTKA